MLTKEWVAGIILGLGVFVSAVGLASENKGAATLQIDAGARGAVPFPHRAHQERVADCNVCHAVFPKEPQSLTRLKKDGQLKPKDVMNKQCIKCHKTEKKAGNNAGPTTCSKCHVR